MNNKRVLNYFLTLSIVGLLIGFLFAMPEITGICYPNDISCIYRISEGVGQPFVLGSFSIGLVFLILRFSRAEIFVAWKKFGVWYIPLATILIILTPVDRGHFLNPDKESITWILSALYIIISLLIIIYTSIRLKSKHGN